MAVGRNPSGSQNSETYPGPYTSPYGQAMFLATGQLIDTPQPIGDFRKFIGGNIGGFSTTSASVQALAALSDYYGDFPLSEQDAVSAPPPWERT